ncbi:L-dopachrome tautomerase-related protein [soil metagenome]
MLFRALGFQLILVCAALSLFPAALAKGPVPIPSQRSVGEISPVALFNGPMPTGVTVSDSGRIFVNFPRWGDDVPFTVAEMVNGQPLAFPNAKINSRDEPDVDKALLSVQSVVIDAKDRLWILDTGSPNFKPVVRGAAKLVCVDLKTDKVVQTISFPTSTALSTSYLNDVRFDLSRGKQGMAFITDSSSTGPNAIVVVDLASGESWRRLSDHSSVKPVSGFLPMVEGQPLRDLHVGSDGIAIGADGKQLYYCPLSSRKLYSVSVDALCDRSISDDDVCRTVCEVVTKGASDGLESDSLGRIYAGDYEHNAIHRISLSGKDETLVCDPRVLWPDTLCLANNGYLYFIANQLHRQARFHDGQDQRQKPYVLFRVKVDAKPVALK